MTIIETILNHKLKEVEALPNFMERDLVPNTNSFLQALQRPRGAPIHIIAEVKQASPSKGQIRIVDPVQRAKIYEQSGATAISCLTDQKFFNGSCDDLQKISEVVSVPVIRKDFIFTKNQIAQARYYGASSYLLMVEVMDKMGTNLKELIQYGRDLGMEPLVETFDTVSIEKAIQAGAKIIGVNCRNFQKEGLPLEFDRFTKLLPQIPQGIIRVAESGISTREDVQKVSPFADVILIGTVLMQQEDEDVKKTISSFQIR